MKRIVLTGAQGTGKTTILNTFDEGEFKKITEVIRNLAKAGKAKINENGDEKSQKLLFKTYKTLLSNREESYVSDRSLVDVCAYTMYLADHNKVSQELVKKQLKAIQKFNAENNDVVYCYFPIEFEAEDDGVRSVNNEFRNEVDENIRKIFKECNILPIVVSGGVEERVGIIDKLNTWIDLGYELFLSSFMILNSEDTETPEPPAAE